jgi:hypothetical protein
VKKKILEMIKKLKRLQVLCLKYLANLYGYKIVMIKIGDGEVTIEGDKELLKYTDISGYTFKKEQLKRK